MNVNEYIHLQLFFFFLSGSTFPQMDFPNPIQMFSLSLSAPITYTQISLFSVSLNTHTNFLLYFDVQCEQ